jgi:hypothetical protein
MFLVFHNQDRRLWIVLFYGIINAFLRHVIAAEKYFNRKCEDMITTTVRGYNHHSPG